MCKCSSSSSRSHCRTLQNFRRIILTELSKWHYRAYVKLLSIKDKFFLNLKHSFLLIYFVASKKTKQKQNKWLLCSKMALTPPILIHRNCIFFRFRSWIRVLLNTLYCKIDNEIFLLQNQAFFMTTSTMGLKSAPRFILGFLKHGNFYAYSTSENFWEWHWPEVWNTPYT